MQTPGITWQNQTGDVAINHYNLFKEDVQLMKSLGIRYYRCVRMGNHACSGGAEAHAMAECTDLLCAACTARPAGVCSALSVTSFGCAPTPLAMDARADQGHAAGCDALASQATG